MKNSNYNVAVAYRIYPRVSKTPFIFKNNKLKLSELCLKSFKDSLQGCNVKIWVLLDGCPPEYKKIFLKYFKASELIFLDLPSIGNHKTFELQIDILKKQNFSKLVYFAEDDYIYLPGKFKEMCEILKLNPRVDFVTPYDHLDYYTSDFSPGLFDTYITPNHHWKRVGSTCLTFLARKKSLIQSERRFKTYSKGNRDVSIWASITKHKVFSIFWLLRKILKLDLSSCRIILDSWRFSSYDILFKKRHILVSPIPSLATHVESDFLAPTINWASFVKKRFNIFFNLIRN